MTELKKRLVVVDGNAILHRAWHAVPPLQTKDGRLVNAVYGFTVMLIKVLKDLKPTHVAITFDLPGGTFRHDAFAAYKAQRTKQPDELYAQIPMVKEVLAGFHLPVYEAPGFEADDVIGTISKLAPADCETIIVTGDNDTLQLVDQKTKVLSPRKGMSDTVLYDEAAVKERYGLEPRQLIDYKAMRGDTSDNLPGLKGIGEKRASELLQKYGDLESIYRAVKKHPEDFKPGVLTALQNGEQEVPLSKKMVTIVRDLDVNFKMTDAAVRPPDLEKLRTVFADFEFHSMMNRVEDGASPAVPAAAHESFANRRTLASDSGSFRGRPPGRPTNTAPSTESKSESGGWHGVGAPDLSHVALAKREAGADVGEHLRGGRRDRTRQNSLSKKDVPEIFQKPEDLAKCFQNSKKISYRLDPKLTGIAFADENGSGASALAGKLMSEISALITSRTEMVGHDVKNDLSTFAVAGIKASAVDDLMLMSYLLNPGSRAHKLSDLVFEATGKTSETAQDNLFADGRLETLATEAAQIFSLADKYRARLIEEKLEKLYLEIERPLVPVLATMERHGIAVDLGFLADTAKTMRAKLDEITKAIVQDAGEDFNVNSPAQLGHVLFETLGLSTKGIRKTPGGQISTGADELEKLRGTHPIIERILEQREYSKLLSTYVTAIPELVDKKDGRLHSHFNQAVTATGRLSSSDPNLQNIPIRTELGREIRRAFVAPPGRVLIGADYSQIELRLAAHLANDAAMIQSFKEGADIHQATAARIWGVKPEAVTFEQRRAAKAINFGILYGMGSHSLAESTGLAASEAKEYIKKYLEVHAGIRVYMEAAKVQARELGYVETLFGRRRYLPEINSGVPFVRAEAERMAVNMPVQGTSADVIKIAMRQLHERIEKEFGLGSDAKLKMILQVHDELVFEADAKIAVEVTAWIKSTMENVAKLQVPLVVDVETGQNWGVME